MLRKIETHGGALENNCILSKLSSGDTSNHHSLCYKNFFKKHNAN